MAGLIRKGAGTDRAQALAWLVLSSLEGALALSRSCRSLEPIDRTAAELRALISELPARPNGGTGRPVAGHRATG